jgi:hypothetical protein
MFMDFFNLPSRKLVDYYELIKNPMSLKGVQKRVRGVHGRNAPTGITDYKNWDQLEHDMSFIWNNAWEYNEDGSFISNMAQTLKVQRFWGPLLVWIQLTCTKDHFEKLLSEAKRHVPEPTHPKLKINMTQPKPNSSGLKLRLGTKASPAPSSGPDTPANRSSATPGVIIDAEALQRQQQHIQASIKTGNRPSSSGTPQPGAGAKNPFSRSGSGTVPLTQLASGSAQQPNGVRTQSPFARPASGTPDIKQPPAAQPGVAAMLPPHAHHLQRPLSGSPHPSPYSTQYSAGMQPSNMYYSQTHSQQPQYIPPPTIAHAEERLRKPGIESILPLITLTAPAVVNNSPRPAVNGSNSLQKPNSNTWKLSIPSDPNLLSHSVTVSLPNNLSTLHLIPTIPVALTNKPWRLFVHVNGQKLTQAFRPMQQQGMNGITTGAGSPPTVPEKDKPVFEVRLPVPVPGQPFGAVNRIDVEILAAVDAPKSSKETSKEGKETDKEKDSDANVKREAEEIVVKESCTILVHLMKGV